MCERDCLKELSDEKMNTWENTGWMSGQERGEEEIFLFQVTCIERVESEKRNQFKNYPTTKWSKWVRGAWMEERKREVFFSIIHHHKD